MLWYDMKCYDSSKESKLIVYFDDSYGSATSQYLPYGGCKGFNQKEIDKVDVNSVGENSLMGYILEVHLKYYDELHELHNDYLLVPENFEIIQNMLSNYCSNIANSYEIKIDGVNKLVPNRLKR